MLLFARGGFATLGILLLSQMQYVDELKLCDGFRRDHKENQQTMEANGFLD